MKQNGVPDTPAQRCVVTVPSTTANIGPGFDCLGAALELNNRFSVRRLSGRVAHFDLIMDGSEGSHLRGGPENLFYKSALRVWKVAGVEPLPLEARVSLSVPPARGLGSSATAIVAGLVGANALCGGPLDKGKLLELAIDIEGHPDNVAPSLLGGLCLTARIPSHAGHRWRVLRSRWHEDVRAVVAIPSLRLPTSEARRAMPRVIPIPDAVTNLGALTVLLQGLSSGNGDLISDGLHDAIHQPYRWPLINHGQEVREAAMDAGAWGCVISGAGPTILALSDRAHERAVGEAMVNSWRQVGVEARYQGLGLQRSGAVFELSD
ncbi:MAG: homoserine kinase [Aphanocapsa feldmannii 288cV]|nr:MAG: homoserine kinase [Aphanocapsa feldmannii 288cV]